MNIFQILDWSILLNILLPQIDLNKDGLISFSELMIAMKAVSFDMDRPSSAGGYDRTDSYK